MRYVEFRAFIYDEYYLIILYYIIFSKLKCLSEDLLTNIILNCETWLDFYSD